ncbi:MAG: hypothetical protein HDR24_04645 [Lachnospiraceae bacterium]|nr:hypothetical protein [Lachnospiraceae bacterium]
MYKQQNFKIKYTLLSLCILLSFLLAGCGPSEEKITQAQELYVQLADMHNQVVEAHKNISDDSLDQDLVALAEKVKQIEQYNLNEFDDEQIDLLIESMNSIMNSYQEYLTVIDQVKEQENAAVLVSIPVTLFNNTEFTFQILAMYGKNEPSQNVNALEDTSGFSPGQSITGLMIYRDVSSTPWVLTLEDASGIAYEIELPVKEYDESGILLTLTYDSETKELKCS